MILVDVWEGNEARAEAELFRERWDIDGPILLDETGEYARLLGLRGVPTNVVVDADGIVRAVGLSRLDELEQAIELLGGR